MEVPSWERRGSWDECVLEMERFLEESRVGEWKE
jgi:hypothetical protein